jgi:hypothetical protein
MKWFLTLLIVISVSAFADRQGTATFKESETATSYALYQVMPDKSAVKITEGVGSPLNFTVPDDTQFFAGYVIAINEGGPSGKSNIDTWIDPGITDVEQISPPKPPENLSVDMAFGLEKN